MNIYAQNTHYLAGIAVITAFVWGIVCNKFAYKRWFKFLCVGFALISVYIILDYTVIGRVQTDTHVFVLAADRTNEFFREMFMNALLYYPVGLALSVFTGIWTVLIGFVLSIGIELWQYFNGAGMAQGTDVIMNTLGAAIGTLPWLIVHRRKRGTDYKGGQ